MRALEQHVKALSYKLKLPFGINVGYRLIDLCLNSFLVNS